MAKRRTPPDSEGAPAGEAAAALEDSLIFRAAVRDVKPLEAPPMPAGAAGTPPRSRIRKGIPTRETTMQTTGDALDEAMPLLPIAPDAASGASLSGALPGGGEALSFQRAGVRTQVVRRLRRGLIPIDGELDLHGLRQTAARDQLADFLTYSRHAGRRCVRIIHGKGHRSGARGAVLKAAVDLWLRRHHDVMAFTSARAIDGGTGAVYVLLRA
jgi:DNA-nicking Smr family endonuclease